MRPYQIVATERILNRIEVSTNYKKTGTLEAGGYIWHTTGSGKTLTSFKTAQLATALPCIDKVLFVVDRKDLDYQTIKEYDRFEKGAANGNRSTAVLQRQLEDRDEKGNFPPLPHHCHHHPEAGCVHHQEPEPSYPGQAHCFWCSMSATAASLAICTPGSWAASSKRAGRNIKVEPVFQKLPIFLALPARPSCPRMLPAAATPHLKTTAQAFGEKLHTYTIVDAINDGNVLPFPR